MVSNVSGNKANRLFEQITAVADYSENTTQTSKPKYLHSSLYTQLELLPVAFLSRSRFLY